MTKLAVSTKTFSQLTKVAQEKELDVEVLAEQVIGQFLQADAEQKMAREIEAFRAMHSRLLSQYPNQYVAIYQGQLVDHDADQLALFLRVDQQYPNEVVLIRQVLPEVDPVYTIHSTRFSRDMK
jgi:hypothetical protein